MKAATIQRITCTALEARFDLHFGGAENIPAHILKPASHFQVFPRTGQASVLVKVELADGSYGFGEAFGLPHPAPVAAFIEHVLAPALIGRPFCDPEADTYDLRHFLGALGEVHGVAAEAMSAIDIALWDLAARRAGQPLCEFLGGGPQPVPTYASPVPMMASTEETATEGRALVAAGYRAVKLKIGRGVDTDLAHVAALREALGPSIEIMVDVNCAYDLDTTTTLARELAPFGLVWLEEPLAAEHIGEMKRLASVSPIPLAAGENLFDRDSFLRLAASGTVQYLQPNISRAGGVSGLRRIDALCARHGVRLAPHGVGGAVAVAAGLAACAAATSFAYFEANLLPNALRDLLAGPPPALGDGRLSPWRGNGHGAEPIPELIASYRWAAHNG